MTSIPQWHQCSRNHIFLSKKETKILLKGTQGTYIISCTCVLNYIPEQDDSKFYA